MSLRTPQDLIEGQNGCPYSEAIVIVELQGALETFITWFEHAEDMAIAIGEARALLTTVGELRIEDRS